MKAMRRVAAIAASTMLAGCSIPEVDLEGKQCPCAAGYTCELSTNTCHASAGDGPRIDANGDGSGSDAAAGSCIPGSTGTLLYGTAFTQGNLQWSEPAGDWSVSGGEAHQNDSTLALAYAYPDQTASEVDYQITATLRQVDGTATDAVGLVLRVQPGSGAHYACDWQPNTGAFAVLAINGAATTLTSVAVDTSQITGYLPTDAQVMDARTSGSQIECCIRGMPTAHLMITDASFATGGPGFRTISMSAAFDDLSINGL
jgi:hypothetical protein